MRAMPERMVPTSRGMIRCSPTRLRRGIRHSKSVARAATECCEKVESLREQRLSLKAREVARLKADSLWIHSRCAGLWLQ